MQTQSLNHCLYNFQQIPAGLEACNIVSNLQKGRLNRSDPGNYRPVSLRPTSVRTKVLESVIRDELSSYLEKKGFLLSTWVYERPINTKSNLLETLEALDKSARRGFWCCIS